MYECVVPVLMVVVLRLGTLFDTLPWFEWSWEPGGVWVGAWDWDCWNGQVVLQPDGKQWKTVACEQSRRKEVVFSHRTRQESLACIWICMFFFIGPAPKKNMSEKTNWFWRERQSKTAQRTSLVGDWHKYVVKRKERDFGIRSVAVQSSKG